MSEQAYNPAAAVNTIKRGQGGYQYLAVKDRVFWFRKENPGGTIHSEMIYFDPATGYAVCKATVLLPEGGHAEGLGSACRADLADKATRKAVQPDQVESFLEFAETAAIGRALARLGYGTEEALDEAGPVDSPRQTGQGAETAQERRNPADVRPTAARAVQGPPTAPALAVAPQDPAIMNAIANWRAVMTEHGIWAEADQKAWAKEVSEGRGLSTLTVSDWEALTTRAQTIPLPARTPRPDGQTVTDKQLRAVYAIARSTRHLTEAEVEARCGELYGVPVSDLTKHQASLFIDALKGEQPA